VDFYRILAQETKNGMWELYPDFVIGESSEDLMIRGGKFYAIWDEERGLWSQNEYDVQRLVDEDLQKEAERRFAKTGVGPIVKYLRSYGSRTWSQYTNYVRDAPDRFHPLDAKVVFANSEVKKTDYASKRLSYSLAEGDISAWEKLTTRLYREEERAKFEWAIGSIIAGDSKRIQKFLVFYGSAGTGKSTILNIIEQLFEGYTTAFDGKALGRSDASFATEAFKNNPLVAIQHDGDLSRIEDNTRLNSIIAHERMLVNEKYKSSYDARIDAMLFVGSNQPVKITDARSGILRRLIDVHPTGVTFSKSEYDSLMHQIPFELGAIAHHCLKVYESMGINFYNGYRPIEMMLQTDIFYNFIEAHFDIFKSQGYVTLKQAYSLYKEWCGDTGIDSPMPMYKLRAELENYFTSFTERGYVDGKQVSSVYEGFIGDKFKAPKAENGSYILVLEETESLFDDEMLHQPAQTASPSGTMYKKWSNVKTVLADIDTSELHWVRVPENYVVIDFDLKDSNGHKALERNLEAASHWPSTYAEISKSGSGIHLHYFYDGDVSQLAVEYAKGIEVKTFNGDASLRRRLSRCNAIPIATISSGLPLKKREKVLKTRTITSERGVRELITRNLRKEIHPGTKPSVDFIKKVLDDAYESGMKYDVTDLRPKILAFANNSTNQAAAALKVVREMKWASEEADSEGSLPSDPGTVDVKDDRIAFFDVEVYPNLFVICWKFIGSDIIVKMINPKAHEVEELFKLKLVGFYNRRYDNHILYAAAMGASTEELFRLSAKLVQGNRAATYGAAYNLSYADIWDFSSEKMGLKKFEIELGILHMELDLPWDQPVDEKDWERVVEYCSNDVRATEAVFENRKGDFVARQILAELSGLTVNDTTQAHTAKIIFGGDREPQKKFIYSDLSKDAGHGNGFPGYKFEMGKSSYRDEDPGEGGYVYAEPGMYENVAVLDVVSMHPTSIELLNLFGPYTTNFSELKTARVAIKRGDFEAARQMLDARLAPYLEDESTAEQLSYALKIVVNTVYGLTSAKFPNPFRDLRNVDNIVAKRGALFMIELKHMIQDAGYDVIHIKTDSVKVPNADPQIRAKIMSFGQMYGYEFEHEATYDKFCLVNDAVYVAGMAKVPWDGEFPGYDWSATGAQFQHPVVFKRLFSGEPETFDDYCEARSVMKGAMYLDLEGPEDEPDHTKMRYVGKTGLFVPVTDGGGTLYRVNEDKYYAVSGTKGHLWMEAHVAKGLGEEVEIDYSYFEKLVDDAIKAIEKYGDYENFTIPEG
jgi:phage/plasmid-associated DNA primase